MSDHRSPPPRKPLAVRRTCCIARSAGRRRAQCRKTSVPTGAVARAAPRPPSSARRTDAGSTPGCPWPGRASFEVVEEIVGGVGKRIAGQRGQRQSTDAVHPAPQHRLDAQQRVAARQVDRLIGALGVGHVAAVDAPVSPYRSASGRSKTTNSSSSGAATARKKSPQSRQFLPFPEPVHNGHRTAARNIPAATGAPPARSYRAPPLARTPMVGCDDGSGVQGVSTMGLATHYLRWKRACGFPAAS